jgi:DNA-directed RNA polymerase specialized sigma24 family protein
MDSDLDLLRSGHPEDVGRFHDRHVDAVNDWFRPRVHDPDDVPDLTAETFAAALMDWRRAEEPVDRWLLSHAERQLAAYKRRGDAERRMRRRLGMKDGHLRAELVAAAARGVPAYGLPRARAVLGAAAVLAIAIVLVVAFTGGRPDEPGQAARPTGTPASRERQLFGGTLAPNVRYRVGAFNPALSFVVRDSGWVAVNTGTTTSLLLARQPGGERPPTQFLVFARLTEVYEPGIRGRTASLRPAPADMAAWLADHPDLRAGKPEPVTVAGVSGEAVPITVRFRRPAHADPGCEEAFRRTCTAIAPGASFFDGTRLRMIVLPTEPDPLVITQMVAPGGDLEELEAAAAPLLESLRIGVE